MRHLALIRRELGVTTLMNLVGPLANPAGAVRQVVGVAERERAPIVAAALVRLGSPHALVVHADVGMDEISPMGDTTVWEVRDEAVLEWHLQPAKFGLATPSLAGLEGGGPVENAERIEALLRKPDSAPPALRAAVLLNAAAAAMVSGAGHDWEAAVAAVTDALHNGDAARRLDALRQVARS
jgi:anthranilate phosphoribosyltransferase